MIRFLLQSLAIFLTSYVAAMFWPWWIIAVPAFLFGYLLRSKASFLAGFVSTGSLWLAKAWMIDAKAAVPLAERVAKIFPWETKPMLLLVMFVLAGLVGGFAALSGSLLKPKKKKRLYY